MHVNIGQQPKTCAAMIQYTSEKQLMLEGFETEFEKWIDPTNKWVVLSPQIPWMNSAKPTIKRCQNPGTPV